MLAAFLVHAFTASGAVCGLLALDAIYASTPTSGAHAWQALGWLGLAVVIDAIDGSFARMVDIKHTLPSIDGAMLDNLVDYFNYVLVPAAWVMHTRLGGAPHVIAVCIAAAMALSSAFQFCHSDAKTPDHYFRGFPSYWNLVMAYIVLLPVSNLAAAITIVASAVLVFVPIKYLYPSRTRRHNRVVLPLTALWGVLVISAWVVWPRDPALATRLMQLSLVYVVIYVAMSLWHTLTPPPIIGDERPTGAVDIPRQ